jgi:Cdc6-like AAA superfamily ATPase
MADPAFGVPANPGPIEEDELSTAERWALLNSTFTPHQPVQTRDIFSGRHDQLFQCLSIVDQIGNHGILHGDRGVGKTSIANITRLIIDTPDKLDRALKVDCTSSDSFSDIIKHIYEKITVEVAKPAPAGFADQKPEFEPVTVASLVKKSSSFNPKHVAQVLGSIPGRLFIILDEFDRLNHDKFKISSFTELLKIISDSGLKVQFLIVGVGENVEQMIGDHLSIGRNLTQIHLHPMVDADIRQIVVSGVIRVGMSISDEIVAQIVDFSCGYPHYTHLLALNACTNALHREELVVEQADLEFARARALDRAHESLKKSYLQATGSNRENIYKEVLQACGEVELDHFNTFQPREVARPLSLILKREMKATQFGGHLLNLCRPERGGILISEGERGRRRYHFRDPLMRAYVKLASTRRR